MPKPDPAALFTLCIGGNDLLALARSGKNAAGTTTALNQILANVHGFTAGLAKAGAKKLLVLTVPDLGLIPEITAPDSGVVPRTATALTKRFNTALTAQIKKAATTYKLTVTVVDLLQLIDAAAAHPAAHGFTNVKSPCWTGDFISKTSGKVCASGAGQDKYLFWDQEHPTAAGHSQIAKAAESALGIGAPAVVASK